ncbi:MAG: cytochrome c oxidase subunit 3 [Myxococcota bacterium]
MSTATIQSRPVISLHPERESRATNYVGMILALASGTMMFGGLFYSYGLIRIRSIAWPPPGVPETPVVIPTLITILLLGSSVVVNRARKSLRAGAETTFRRLMMSAIVLGIVFIALQSQVWVDLWYGGLTLGAGAYASLFYFLTAFHALHVLIGLGVLGWAYVAAPRSASPVTRDARVHLSAMFWHFVAVVWLVIYALVYLF